MDHRASPSLRVVVSTARIREAGRKMRTSLIAAVQPAAIMTLSAR
jgi:hypothetical protein